MNQTRNHCSVHSVGSQPVPVRFGFNYPTAETAWVTGSLNQWRPAARSLHPTGGGHWLKNTVVAPGRYESYLVVDGCWMPDPLAKDQVPNPFDGRNSILEVVCQSNAAQLAAADKFSLKNTNNLQPRSYEQTDPSNQQ